MALRAVWVDEEQLSLRATTRNPGFRCLDDGSSLQRPTSTFTLGDALWRASTLADQVCGVVASGHALLDAQLPGGGWPLGSLCDILQDPGSHREWQLLLPALVTSQAGSLAAGNTAGVKVTVSAITPSWVTLIGTPYTPFGPGLAARGLDVMHLLWVQAQTPAERLWAAEQALRCADVAAVLVWLGLVPTAALRRLQMAAHNHAKLLFALRPANARLSASPATLRLRLLPAPPDGNPDALCIELLKRRGPPLTQPLVLPTREVPYALDRFAA